MKSKIHVTQHNFQIFILNINLSRGIVASHTFKYIIQQGLNPLLSCDWSVRFHCFCSFDPLLIAKKLIRILDIFCGHLLLLLSSIWKYSNSSDILVGKIHLTTDFFRHFDQNSGRKSSQISLMLSCLYHQNSSKIIFENKTADRRFL